MDGGFEHSILPIHTTIELLPAVCLYLYANHGHGDLKTSQWCYREHLAFSFMILDHGPHPQAHGSNSSTMSIGCDVQGEWATAIFTTQQEDKNEAVEDKDVRALFSKCCK